MKTEIQVIAHSLTGQIKDLIDVLEANGYSTTEHAMDCEDISIEDFTGIREMLNEWDRQCNNLLKELRIKESHYLMNLVRGTTGYVLRFKKELNSKLSTLTLTNDRLKNSYVIKIHPF